MADVSGNQNSLLAFEAHLLESTLRAVILHTRETLAPQEAEAAIERILFLEAVCPLSGRLQLVAGRYVPAEPSVCTSLRPICTSIRASFLAPARLSSTNGSRSYTRMSIFMLVAEVFLSSSTQDCSRAELSSLMTSRPVAGRTRHSQSFSSICPSL